MGKSKMNGIYILDWYDSDFEPVTIYRIRNGITKRTILEIRVKRPQ